MRRERRLRADADFRRVRREGRSWSHPLCVLLAAPRPDAGPTRVGFSASKRVGGAVVRNRAKRRFREAVRARYEALAAGRDLVLIVRPAAASATFKEITAAVEELLVRADLLTVDPSCAGCSSG